MIQVMWAEVLDIRMVSPFYAAGVTGSYGGESIGRGRLNGRGCGYPKIAPKTKGDILVGSGGRAAGYGSRSGRGAGCGDCRGKGGPNGLGGTNR